jgi:hypothetical protein
MRLQLPNRKRRPLAGDCGDRRASAKRPQSQSDSPRCLPPNGPAARDTGISTYVWILDNNKPATRKGKVINAVDMFGKMR